MLCQQNGDQIRAKLGGGPGGPPHPPPPPSILGEEEKISEGRKSGRASKTNPCCPWLKV